MPPRWVSGQSWPKRTPLPVNPIYVPFYRKKLTETENNYDVGNWELLAIKRAFEEWRLWLEGALHPFTLLTDHRNLQYLQEAKRLNARQARWAPFFTCFNFQVTYLPGLKNAKADALSCHFPSMRNPEPLSCILPSFCFLSPVIWHLQQRFLDLNHTSPPPERPPKKTYVPS